jgi:hypothetical protein
LVLGTSALAWPTAAAVPNMLVQQGRLLQTDGTPATGTVSVAFALYDASTGGNKLWTETQSITLDSGYFSAVLGETTAIPATTFDGTPRYLGIAVNNDAEMVPREAVESVPYALLAGNVNGDITPASVSINGKVVIDNNGNWVGPPTGLQGPVGPAGPAGPPGIFSGTFVGPVTFDGPVSVIGATGDVTANSFKPQFDSGWFYVTNTSGDIVVPNTLNAFPSHFTLLSCGNLGVPGLMPTVLNPSFNNCVTRVVTNTVGYWDGGGMNPDPITTTRSDFLIPMISNRWAWGYWSNSAGWACPSDDDNICYTGYYRILAWR